MRYCLSDRLIVGVDSMNIMEFTQRYGLVSLDMWTRGLISCSLVGILYIGGIWGYMWYIGWYMRYIIYRDGI